MSSFKELEIILYDYIILIKLICCKIKYAAFVCTQRKYFYFCILGEFYTVHFMKLNKTNIYLYVFSYNSFML